jgi:hypothetical protein
MATVKAIVDIWGKDSLIIKAGNEGELPDENAKALEQNGHVQIIKAKTKELKIEDGTN